jgi:predicted RNA binding protein YcfA (HicA-like mRNA interferase family)
MKMRDMKRFLGEHGWHYTYSKGDHHQFVHANKPGKVTLAGHDSRDIPAVIEARILKQAGLTSKELREWQNR